MKRRGTIRFAPFRYTWAGLFTQVPDAQLADYLANTEAHESYGASWRIGNIETTQVRDDQIIYGLFGSEAVPSDIYYDEALREFVIVPGNARVSTLVRFLVWPRRHVVAAESGALGLSKFARTFPAVVTTAPELSGATMELSPIVQESNLVERIASLDVVERITFTLRPSNPDMRELWRPVDEDIKEMRASKVVRQIYPRDAQSLNIEADSIKRNFAQVADGYGDATVTGKEQGEKRIITSRPQDNVAVDYDHDEAKLHARAYVELSKLLGDG